MTTNSFSIRRWSFGSFRSWHLWLSIALSLPILIVSVTAVLLAHDKTLGLKEVRVNANWLPGVAAGKLEALEPRALWASPDGAQWLGTKAGLYRVRGEQVEHVQDLGRAEVRSLQMAGEHLVAATSKGLYRVSLDRGVGERVARGDFWSLANGAQGLIAVGKYEQLLHSQDHGATWVEHAAGRMAGERVAAGQTSKPDDGSVPMSKLVMDLHTGKAFLGKQYEWLWIDLIGVTMTLLTLTGLVMWWRGQRRKATALSTQAQPIEEPAVRAVEPPANLA